MHICDSKESLKDLETDMQNLQDEMLWERSDYLCRKFRMEMIRRIKPLDVCMYVCM